MMTRAARRFLVDDRGQDLIEYALLTAVVSVIGFVLFASVRDGMFDVYTNWQLGAQDAWEPCPPAPAACP
jgi:Flp pilus assembly pilin Flp